MDLNANMNMKVLERTALFLYKNGNNASEVEIQSTISFLEFLAIPVASGDNMDPEDYTPDQMITWLLDLYNEKVKKVSKRHKNK